MALLGRLTFGPAEATSAKTFTGNQCWDNKSQDRETGNGGAILRVTAHEKFLSVVPRNEGAVFDDSES